ncbi:hypothetical protein L1887_08594 [Cichorium endivia]|nr:hypothetical protein L1887_08594 [Cichorium endivia]
MHSKSPNTYGTTFSVASQLPGRLATFVFDGINFDIEAESGQFWADLARSLKARSSQKKVYLSAEVPCLFPDVHLGSAIEAGLFDYIWVRFYNNQQCEYRENADALLVAWNQWTQVNSSHILLGLPASPGATLSGYIPPEVLTSTVLPLIKTSPKYGGVMLWDTFYDQQNGYSAAIKNSV